ncbi:MAG: hypothetical protein NTX52_01475, partial [Planctomycetota bacterium]|nr:hypothetical protein [Planctomycetota bacterium]
MKTAKMLMVVLVLALAVLVWPAEVSKAAPMGMAFTYQVRLIDANSAADGLYDLQFKLYDANVAGAQKGSTINVNDLDVIDGYFTVEVDFGSDVFNGDARWLQIGIRPGELNDPNKYTILRPRQEVTPTPYALHTYGLSVIADNIFVGQGAGVSNTIGAGNTFSGYQAGRSNSEGSSNTFLGNMAGHSNTIGYCNTFLGSNAGGRNTTGSGNVFIGNEAGSKETGSNKMYIANLIYGDFSTGNVGIGEANPVDKLVVGQGGNIVLKAAGDDAGDIIFQTAT